jgi:hypothetical protein
MALLGANLPRIYTLGSDLYSRKGENFQSSKAVYKE